MGPQQPNNRLYVYDPGRIRLFMVVKYQPAACNGFGNMVRSRNPVSSTVRGKNAQQAVRQSVSAVCYAAMNPKTSRLDVVMKGQSNNSAAVFDHPPNGCDKAIVPLRGNQVPLSRRTIGCTAMIRTRSACSWQPNTNRQPYNGFRQSVAVS